VFGEARDYTERASTVGTELVSAAREEVG